MVLLDLEASAHDLHYYCDTKTHYIVSYREFLYCELLCIYCDYRGKTKWHNTDAMLT